jgi:hypothetical protein
MRFSFPSILLDCNIGMDYLDIALRGLTIGVLIGFILMYVLRPREPYPRWTLTPFEQPWMLVIIVLMILILFKWDILIGTLFTISMLGITMDVMVYGKHYVPVDSKSPLRTFAEKASMPLEAGIASSSTSVFSGLPLAQSDIQSDLPTPQYPMFAGLYGPQPGEPSLFH